nr:beta-L-arabinofuranosidase domain-containing protein [uncultured Actinoplanes sp.]
MSGPLLPTSTATARLRPVEQATITGGLLAARQQANGNAAVPAGRDRLESAGNLDNLRIAAGTGTGDRRGPVFMDSDVYKWLEAAAWEYARRPSPALLEAQRDVSAIVAAAQQPDGYLNSMVEQRYANLPWSHEHYCAGHLIQAAVAQARCTGDKTLLDVAVRFADHLVATFGPDRRHDVDGHPIIEMALVELYRETGRRDYLDLARYFVDARGHGLIAGYGLEPTYFSDRVPVREQTTVEGHAVRAVYLGAGAADVALETGDEELLAAQRRQFAHMLATKSYLTGGLGSRWEGESFGDPYELPSDRAYAETCAAVGGFQWAWRLLLATGEPGYADAAERMLLNGFLAGVSLSGTEYFYVNPLQLRSGAHPDENRSPAHGRRGWFDCACCPPNVMRTLASLDGYLATVDADGIQLQLYAPATVEARGVRLAVTTDYPWDGRIQVRIEATPEEEWTLSLRVPAWAEGARLDGEPVASGSYATVRRAWHAGDTVELELPMAVRVTGADPRIDAVRDCVAIERGPLVYAVEHPQADDLSLVSVGEPEHRADLLEGVTVIGVDAAVTQHAAPPWPYGTPKVADTTPEEVSAVPYFAWANRGIGPMRVWLHDGRR